MSRKDKDKDKKKKKASAKSAPGIGNAVPDSEAEFLENYDADDFERPSVTADILVFTVRDDDLCLLLVKRGVHPFKGKWALPGGFVRMDETAEDAARRELAEETGVTDAYVEQLYTFSAVDRDPRTRVISVAYFAAVPYERLSYEAGDDASDAKLFRIEKDGGILRFVSDDGDSATDSELAFDHGEIVRTAVRRLRGKADYTNVIFRFLPDSSAVALPDLRRVYNAVAFRNLDNGNFSRWLLHRYMKKGEETLVKTGESRRGSGGKGRNAVLYRLIETPEED